MPNQCQTKTLSCSNAKQTLPNSLPKQTESFPKTDTPCLLQSHRKPWSIQYHGAARPSCDSASILWLRVHTGAYRSCCRSTSMLGFRVHAGASILNLHLHAVVLWQALWPPTFPLLKTCQLAGPSNLPLCSFFKNVCTKKRTADFTGTGTKDFVLRMEPKTLYWEWNQTLCTENGTKDVVLRMEPQTLYWEWNWRLCTENGTKNPQHL